MIVAVGDDDVDVDVVVIDLVVATGTHKGEIVSVRARHLARRATDLLGLPARLVVERGEPRVELS